MFSNLLTLAVVDDYHELAHIAEQLVPKADYIELGTTEDTPHPYDMYVGVVYTGPEPTQDAINDLLKHAEITLL